MINGDRLRDLRIEYGYTKEELAELLSIGVAQIWRYETGKTDPSSEVVARYAKLFHVSSDYLLGLTNDPCGQQDADLSHKERHIIAALRRGEKLEAIKAIANDE